MWGREQRNCGARQEKLTVTKAKKIWDTDSILFWEFPLFSLTDKSKFKWAVRCYVSSKPLTAPGLILCYGVLWLCHVFSKRKHHARLYLPYSLISFICMVINWNIIQEIDIQNMPPPLLISRSIRNPTLESLGWEAFDQGESHNIFHQHYCYACFYLTLKKPSINLG